VTIDDGLLTAKQVSLLTGLKPTTIRDPRFRERTGLPIIRLGRRVVRFRAADVRRWIETRWVSDPPIT
jgi:predicted DNA-binding transcriptional regulator AlpA